MTSLALALLAIPFVFGVVRFATSGSDWRYLVVAVASTLGAILVQRRRGGGATAKGLVGTFAGAALLAAPVAAAVGARSVIAVGVVALGFAACSATGAALLMRTRRAGA